MQESSQKLLVVLALGALYFIWGSTYIAMRFAMDSFPPFMMAALRFSIAGGLLYTFLRLCGAPAPKRQEWLGASIVGGLLLTIGNAGVAYAEQTVSSGVAALAIATVPLWMAVFSGIWQQWPNQREWLGILVGTVGVGSAQYGRSLAGKPVGGWDTVIFSGLLGTRFDLEQVSGDARRGYVECCADACRRCATDSH